LCDRHEEQQKLRLLGGVMPVHRHDVGGRERLRERTSKTVARNRSAVRTKTVRGERRYSNTVQTQGKSQGLFISLLTFRAAGP
jgi:hypothetical protein